MMRRISSFSSVPAAVAMLGLGVIIGCDRPSDDAAVSSAQNLAAQAACHLNDGTLGHQDEVRACEPGNQKKTTICHVPPGNPANAHTLCIGNAGVPAHLRNHPDYLGPCKRENPGPPPADAGTPGTGGAGGSAAGGAGGVQVDGSGGTGGVQVDGSGGTGGVVVIQ
jgi:hypothetical protein